jgi:DNA-binding NarL/FixJ family response regulator
MAKIKVLLIEDNRLLREGTTEILNEQKDIREQERSGNGQETDAGRGVARSWSQKSQEFEGA